MTYRTNAEAFRRAMRDEPLADALIDRILTLADRHQTLQQIATNENVGDKFAQEEAELEGALQACKGGPVRHVLMGGDPRGYTVRLVLASGRSNTLGGRESGYGVPTRERDARQIEMAARANARHWTQE